MDIVGLSRIKWVCNRYSGSAMDIAGLYKIERLFMDIVGL